MIDNKDAAASRALANVLQAWPSSGPDIDAILTVLNDEEVSERSLMLQSLALNAWFMHRVDNPEAIYDVLLRDDPLQQAKAKVKTSARGAAVAFLRDQLAAGPVKVADLRRANRERPYELDWNALQNAARFLGIRRGTKGDSNGEWSLPAREVITVTLADGPRMQSLVRSRALAHGVADELNAAADELGVIRSGNKWLLPPEKSAAKPRSR